TFCKWCVAVDTSSIVAALSAIVLGQELKKGGEKAIAAAFPPRRVELASLAVAALATGLPFVWGEYPVIPPLPPEIAALQVPGKIPPASSTACGSPFCPKPPPTIAEVRKNFGDRAAFVRKMVPLEMPPGALPAARAYLCAPAELQDRLADALYAAM